MTIMIKCALESGEVPKGPIFSDAAAGAAMIASNTRWLTPSA
jgi:hypothetical protein